MLHLQHQHHLSDNYMYILWISSSFNRFHHHDEQHHDEQHHSHHDQGCKRPGDDIDDNKSKSYWDGRERQGEVKKIWFLFQSKYISILNCLSFVLCIRWASMTKRTRLLWGNAFVENFLPIFIFLSFSSLLLYQAMKLCDQNIFIWLPTIFGILERSMTENKQQL